MSIELQKLLIAGSLLYAVGITLTCPCDPLLGCHLPHFYLATLTPVAMVIYLNSGTISVEPE
jgi:hypothetical protein